jgi:hypothetical protein
MLVLGMLLAGAFVSGASGTTEPRMVRIRGVLVRHPPQVVLLARSRARPDRQADPAGRGPKKLIELLG